MTYSGDNARVSWSIDLNLLNFRKALAELVIGYGGEVSAHLAQECNIVWSVSNHLHPVAVVFFP